MRRLFLPALVVSSSLWFALSACSAAGTGGNFNEAGQGGTAGSDDPGGPGGADGGSGDAGTSDGGTSSSGSAGTIQTTGGAGGKAGSTSQGGTGGSTSTANVLLYAHTDLELYQLDTKDLTSVTDLGAFDCVGNASAGQDKAMTDLAVDKDGKLWGVSDNNVYALQTSDDKKTVHCTQTIKLQSTGASAAVFYGLTFAPVGVASTTKEVLIAGNTAGEMWSVDDQGKVSLLGNLGTVPANDGHKHTYVKANVGKNWELSGDLVFLANNGSPLGYATVRDCPNPPSTVGCNSVNTLVEIDMAKLGKAAPGPMLKSVRGQAVERSGCKDTLGGDYGNMYGIAAWGDRVYGFSRDGHLVDLDTSDGSGCLVRTFDGTKFSGAGVTTLAPVIPPIN